MSSAPVPGPARLAGMRTSPAATASAGSTGHPAVDAVIQAIANAAGLPPADQIAQYEAAHCTLQETLATIET